jgi:Cu-processing system permease protein
MIAVAIARKELRDALRRRWFWLFSAAFAALAGLLANLALPGGIGAGASGFARSAASLVTLVQLVVPLMGLLLGAQALAADRERGTLRFLLAHPVSRAEVLAGTFAGLALALLGTVCLGFGCAGLVTALRGGAADARTFLRIAALSALLAVAMLAIGLLIGAWSRRPGAAIGTAVFAWLLLGFLGDLGLMGAAVFTRMPVSVLFTATALNPVEAFRLAALAGFPGSLDVLGPSGTYAVDRYGAAVAPLLTAVLACWTLLACGAAWHRFTRARDL